MSKPATIPSGTEVACPRCFRKVALTTRAINLSPGLRLSGADFGLPAGTWPSCAKCGAWWWLMEEGRLHTRTLGWVPAMAERTGVSEPSGD